MPMKDTTQANATAKTAFGCLNGLAAEPWVAPLMKLYSSVLCIFVRGLDRAGAWSGPRVIPSARRGPGRVVRAGDAGERVKRRQRDGERRAVLRAELGDDGGHPVAPDGPAAREDRPALVGDDDQDHSPVLGARLPADEA